MSETESAGKDQRAKRGALLAGAPGDVLEEYSRAVQSGETDAATLEHLLAALEAAAAAAGTNDVVISRRMGEQLVSARLVWQVTGLNVCVGSGYAPDEYRLRGDRDTPRHVAPAGTGRSAQEAYDTLRRDGAEPEAALRLAELCTQ